MNDRIAIITKILKSRNSPFAPASSKQLAKIAKMAVAEKIPLYKLERMSLSEAFAAIIIVSKKMEAYL